MPPRAHCPQSSSFATPLVMSLNHSVAYCTVIIALLSDCSLDFIMWFACYCLFVCFFLMKLGSWIITFQLDSGLLVLGVFI